jgi:hypothetical protein
MPFTLEEELKILLSVIINGRFYLKKLYENFLKGEWL